MPRRQDITSVLVIGSGPIVIGQACEFDYSGTQACRVLRAEGIRVVLLNSNPATIMTDPEFADATYVEPITTEVIEAIIAKERPDAMLATLGGQTALNLSKEAEDLGIWEKHGVRLIGVDIKAIDKAEDREKFRKWMIELGVPVATAKTANSFLEGKDLTVTAAELQMFFEGGELQRTVARGGGEGIERPLAVSKSFKLQADSLDALMPAQQLEEVIAIGDARGESVDTTRADTTARADSTRAPAAASATALALSGNDWIMGDTITGFFAAAPDTAAAKPGEPAKPDSTTVLKRILSRGSALSLYRIEQKKPAEPAGGTATETSAKKGINFLSGSEIELTFEDGELKVADVRGLEKGLYLDPNQTLESPAPATESAKPTEPAATGARPGGTG